MSTALLLAGGVVGWCWLFAIPWLGATQVESKHFYSWSCFRRDSGVGFVLFLNHSFIHPLQVVRLWGLLVTFGFVALALTNRKTRTVASDRKRHFG